VSVHGQTAIRATFLRPNGQFTGAQVEVAWLNQKLVKMVLHPGFTTPGGSGWPEPPQVPDSQRISLLATFNFGFLMHAAQGRYRQEDTTAVPLRNGAASLRPTRMVTSMWPGRTWPGTDVAAVHQRLVLLVDHGLITSDLDKIVRDAAAVRAMELDKQPSLGVVVPRTLTKTSSPIPSGASSRQRKKSLRSLLVDEPTGPGDLDGWTVGVAPLRCVPDILGLSAT